MVVGIALCGKNDIDKIAKHPLTPSLGKLVAHESTQVKPLTGLNSYG